MLRGKRAVVGAIVTAGLVLSGCSMHSGSAASSGTGPITFAAEDPHGSTTNLVQLWNAAHPGEQVRLQRLPADPDSQHATLLQDLARPAAGNDVVELRTADTAELAAQGWLRPFGAHDLQVATLLSKAVAAASYQGKLVAAPWDIDAGLLYYRSDLLNAAPGTWKQLTADCATARQLRIGCYAGQYAKGADLAANVLEAVGSAGGQLLKPDGTVADLAAPGVQRGIGFLATSYRDGTIPRAAVTYQASQTSQAFDSGSLLFMRNWASNYHATEISAMHARFTLAVLPGQSGPGTPALAGHELGVRAGSQHPVTALSFVRFLESAANQRSRLETDGRGPVTVASYQDAALRARYPQLAPLQQSIDRSTDLVNPDYPGVSDAISDSSYPAITGAEPVPAATSRLQKAIAAATG